MQPGLTTVKLGRFNVSRGNSPSVENSSLIAEIKTIASITHENAVIVIYANQKRLNLSTLLDNVDIRKMVILNMDKQIMFIKEGDDIIIDTDNNYRILLPLLNVHWSPILVGNINLQEISNVTLNYRALLETPDNFKTITKLNSLQFIDINDQSYTFPEMSIDNKQIYHIRNFDCKFMYMVYYFTDRHETFTGLKLTCDDKLPSCPIILFREDKIIANTTIQGGKDIDIILEPTNNVNITSTNLLTIGDDLKYRITNYFDHDIYLNLVIPLNGKKVVESDCQIQVNDLTAIITLRLKSRQDNEFNCHLVIL